MSKHTVPGGANHGAIQCLLAQHLRIADGITLDPATGNVIEVSFATDLTPAEQSAFDTLVGNLINPQDWEPTMKQRFKNDTTELDAFLARPNNQITLTMAVAALKALIRFVRATART